MKGSVKVTSQYFPEQTITLKPHHKAYVKDGQLAVTKVNDFTPYRWKEGLICFKDEPFQTIMEDFEKYYGIRIIINNKKVLKYSYNGKLNSGSISFQCSCNISDSTFLYGFGPYCGSSSCKR